MASRHSTQPRVAGAERRHKAAPAAVVVHSPGHAEQPDSALHHRLRIGIVSALAGVPSLSFNELKALLDASDGNLSVHARKLEDAGYVECQKSFEDRRPKTEYRLTSAGRRALQRYLNHLEALVHTTRATLRR